MMTTGRWMGRVAALTAAMGLLTHCGPQDVPSAEAAQAAALTTSITFTATADARVEATYPAQNFGTAAFLGADTSPGIQSYLRFSVTGLSGTVTRTVLRLYVTDGTDNGPQLFTTAGGWSEGGLTWNNRPAPGTFLNDAGALAAGTWIEYDVTGLVQGSGEYNFVVVPQASNGVDFASRENSNTAQRPQLVVTTESGTTEPPPPGDCGATREVLGNWGGDTYVARDQPDTHFGTSTALVADASPYSEVAFSVQLPEPQVGEEFVSAKVRLYAFDGTSDGPAIYVGSTFVQEESASWNTSRPVPVGPALGDKGAISANTWVEYDVTAELRGTADHWTTFVLVPTSGDGVRFYSREYGTASLRPQLKVTYRQTGTCTSGPFGWARQYGGAGVESVIDTATDKDGSIVVLGRGQKGFTFGGASYPGWDDLVLARYSAQGEHLWSRPYHARVSGQIVNPNAVTVTPEGNILVVGDYQGAPDLGLGSLPNADTIAVFVAKFSPSGRPVWNRGIRAGFTYADGTWEPRRLHANDVATDANGSLIVVGEGYGPADFGGGEVQTGVAFTESNPGLFIAKYQWDGAHLWSKGVPESACGLGVVARAVATDSQGHILVGGHSCRNSELGGAYAGTPFVARYTPGGAREWVRNLDGVAGDVLAVATGPSDAVYFAGRFQGRTTFAGREVRSVNPDDRYGATFDLMVGAWSAQGDERWLRDLPDVAGSAHATRLAVDTWGYAFVAGSIPTGADLGNGPMPGGAFVARFGPYGPSGACRWARSLGKDSPAPSVHTRPSGDAVAGMSLAGPLTVNGRTFTPNGIPDVLLLQLLP